MFRTLPQRAQGTRPEIGLLLSGTLAPTDTRLQRRIQYLIGKELLSRLSFLTGRRLRILSELFGSGGDSVWMQPPFYCDYGSNIHLGERVYFNFNSAFGEHRDNRFIVCIGDGFVSNKAGNRGGCDEELFSHVHRIPFSVCVRR